VWALGSEKKSAKIFNRFQNSVVHIV